MNREGNSLSGESLRFITSQFSIAPKDSIASMA